MGCASEVPLDASGLPLLDGGGFGHGGASAAQGGGSAVGGGSGSNVPGGGLGAPSSGGEPSSGPGAGPPPSSPPATCGNGSLDPNEACDGANLNVCVPGCIVDADPLGTFLGAGTCQTPGDKCAPCHDPTGKPTGACAPP